jgi:hypothetical protein
MVTEQLSTPLRGSERRLTWLWCGILLLFLVGFAARAAPLFQPHGRLFWQFPTEDGYLLLTIARNLGIGKGMTVADGTIPTNGGQPLAILAWAPLFAISGGGRVLGVGLVLLVEIGIAFLASLLLKRLAFEIVGDGFLKAPLAWLAAGTWFASPVALPHTMNCLETGMYLAAVIAVALSFVRLSGTDGDWSARSIVGFGALLGLAFWTRNDAVFLCGAAAVSHVLLRGRCTIARRVVEAVGFCATAGIAALPWVLFNVVRFGHPVPISGRSEAMFVELGENLPRLPISLTESFLTLVPIPDAWENVRAVQIGTAVLLVAGGVPLLIWVCRRTGGIARRLYCLAALYAGFLVVYYGLIFGAPHFLARYLAPTTPFFIVLWVSIAQAAFARLSPALVRGVLAVVVGSAVFVAGAFGARRYARGLTHEHVQVVNWVREHVPESTWVGAAQSGTLGFFHDRTINLDGKVNPEALRARKERRIPEYALAKGVDFIVDWADFAAWVKLPGFQSRMEVLVHDPEHNLSVLRRKGAQTLQELRSNPVSATEAPGSVE